MLGIAYLGTIADKDKADRMKITFDIDCTPEEARRLLGLPDLTSVHELYLTQLKQFVQQGSGSPPALAEAMLKSWAPMGEASLGAWQQMLAQLASGGTSSPKT
jgi:hypothetical protein